MEFMGISVVASIAIMAYLAGEAVKLLTLDNKWIPVICGLFGGLLGLAGMYTVADFPAGDVLSAIAVGIASGLSATGADQICRQLKDTDKTGT